MAELNPQMTALKNNYENLLLAEYTSEKFDERRAEHLVQAYT